MRPSSRDVPEAAVTSTSRVLNAARSAKDADISTKSR
jgi:hypothetical protein